MAEIPVIDPTFVLVVGPNGQLTVSQVVGGNLGSATLGQLLTGQRNIADTAKLLEALIINNLT